MSYTKSLLLKFIIGSLFLITFVGLQKNSYAVEATGVTLRIELNQSNIAAPTLTSVKKETVNPERYKVTYTRDFLVVKELDATGNELYSGQVRRITSVPRAPVPPATEPGYTETILNPLVINFPYFTEATRVKVFAADGTTLLLDIDLLANGFAPPPTQGPRFSDCNVCGYCAGKPDPDGLQACMDCMYPGVAKADTLKIDPMTNRPPAPKVGKYYSQLGCIDVGDKGFSEEGAAGAVLNVLLTRFIFPITGVLAMLGLIYGAFLIIRSQDNPEQIAKGKLWIKGSIVGALFVFLAVLLVQIIGGDVLKIPGFGE